MNNIPTLIIVRMLLITGCSLSVLFIGDPDIHDAILELIASWSK